MKKCYNNNVLQISKMFNKLVPKYIEYFYRMYFGTPTVNLFKIHILSFAWG